MLIPADMVLTIELELRRKTPDEGVGPDSDMLVRTLAESSARCAKATDRCDERLRFHRSIVGMLARLRPRTGDEGRA